MIREDFHAHVYFDLEAIDTARQVNQQAMDQLPCARISTLREREVGPHTKPMFEVVFAAENREQVVQWLEQNRQGLSVLVHPVTDDDYHAHTDGALWLGQPLALKLETLR
ncbi:DOPA 4,5-dioxygenase [Bacterioplanes sanyensis]|uniref:DOPA 4,5-dioxygenase family protein n=1 Tax=Bacterioplanes sanyensis TaxID=1249553 RepID=UPI001679AD8B|nr:DOPA 4,5-dioxygenase family protein [Bacterioplanes sanyensis]GGY48940.1 DOPA 4,5-dioxygenase [Bacterioplanes sanyensis]